MRKFSSGLLLGLLIIPMSSAIALMCGWVRLHATADPPHWEAFVAREALAASIARQAPKLQNPIAATSSNLRSGLKIYRDNCAGCHGDSGKPSHWGTTAFYPRVPQFDTDLPPKPDWQRFWIVKHGVRYTGMAAWEGEISDENIWTVVTFLQNLRNLPPDVQAEWKARGQPH
jgi:mono/diheme cytochrome c family protein